MGIILFQVGLHGLLKAAYINYLSTMTGTGIAAIF
jgi:hypothetical protein